MLNDQKNFPRDKILKVETFVKLIKQLQANNNSSRRNCFFFYEMWQVPSSQSTVCAVISNILCHFLTPTKTFGVRSEKNTKLLQSSLVELLFGEMVKSKNKEIYTKVSAYKSVLIFPVFNTLLLLLKNCFERNALFKPVLIQSLQFLANVLFPEVLITYLIKLP